MIIEVWYLKEGTCQPAKRKVDFEHPNSPLEVMDFVLL